MNNIKWLFFDIGYTLVNEDLCHDIRIDMLVTNENRLGNNITYDDIYNDMLKASKVYSSSPFKKVLKDRGIIDKYPYLKEYEEPYKEAKKLLQDLSTKYHIGVIGNQLEGTALRLNQFGLSEYIDVCISSAEEGISKPDIAIYELALNRANCKANQAMMIGDRLDNDIYPAKLLGLKTVWIKQGFGGMQEPKSDAYVADYSINNLDDLRAILL